jgi:hypothetical protein
MRLFGSQGDQPLTIHPHGGISFELKDFTMRIGYQSGQQVPFFFQG